MLELRLHTINCQNSCSRVRQDLASLLMALLVIMAMGLWAAPALAVHASTNGSPTTTQVNVSASQAARAARRKYGGKVLSVMLDTDAKAPYYRIKLLSAGQVRVVHVMAMDKPQK